METDQDSRQMEDVTTQVYEQQNEKYLSALQDTYNKIQNNLRQMAEEGSKLIEQQAEAVFKKRDKEIMKLSSLSNKNYIQTLNNYLESLELVKDINKAEPKLDENKMEEVDMANKLVNEREDVLYGNYESFFEDVEKKDEIVIPSINITLTKEVRNLPDNFFNRIDIVSPEYPQLILKNLPSNASESDIWEMLIPINKWYDNVKDLEITTNQYTRSDIHAIVNILSIVYENIGSNEKLVDYEHDEEIVIAQFFKLGMIEKMDPYDQYRLLCQLLIFHSYAIIISSNFKEQNKKRKEDDQILYKINDIFESMIMDILLGETSFRAISILFAYVDCLVEVLKASDFFYVYNYDLFLYYWWNTMIYVGALFSKKYNHQFISWENSSLEVSISNGSPLHIYIPTKCYLFDDIVSLKNRKVCNLFQRLWMSAPYINYTIQNTKQMHSQLKTYVFAREEMTSVNSTVEKKMILDNCSLPEGSGLFLTPVKRFDPSFIPCLLSSLLTQLNVDSTRDYDLIQWKNQYLLTRLCNELKKKPQEILEYINYQIAAYLQLRKQYIDKKDVFVTTLTDQQTLTRDDYIFKEEIILPVWEQAFKVGNEIYYYYYNADIKMLRQMYSDINKDTKPGQLSFKTLAEAENYVNTLQMKWGVDMEKNPIYFDFPYTASGEIKPGDLNWWLVKMKKLTDLTRNRLPLVFVINNFVAVNNGPARNQYIFECGLFLIANCITNYLHKKLNKIEVGKLIKEVTTKQNIDEINDYEELYSYISHFTGEEEERRDFIHFAQEYINSIKTGGKAISFRSEQFCNSIEFFHSPSIYGKIYDRVEEIEANYSRGYEIIKNMNTRTNELFDIAFKQNEQTLSQLKGTNRNYLTLYSEVFTKLKLAEQELVTKNNTIESLEAQIKLYTDKELPQLIANANSINQQTQTKLEQNDKAIADAKSALLNALATVNASDSAVTSSLNELKKLLDSDNNGKIDAVEKMEATQKSIDTVTKTVTNANDKIDKTKDAIVGTGTTIVETGDKIDSISKNILDQGEVNKQNIVLVKKQIDDAIKLLHDQKEKGVITDEHYNQFYSTATEYIKALSTEGEKIISSIDSINKQKTSVEESLGAKTKDILDQMKNEIQTKYNENQEIYESLRKQINIYKQIFNYILDEDSFRKLVAEVESGYLKSFDDFKVALRQGLALGLIRKDELRKQTLNTLIDTSNNYYLSTIAKACSDELKEIIKHIESESKVQFSSSYSPAETISIQQIMSDKGILESIREKIKPYFIKIKNYYSEQYGKMLSVIRGKEKISGSSFISKYFDQLINNLLHVCISMASIISTISRKGIELFKGAFIEAVLEPVEGNIIACYNLCGLISNLEKANFKQTTDIDNIMNSLSNIRDAIYSYRTNYSIKFDQSNSGSINSQVELFSLQQNFITLQKECIRLQNLNEEKDKKIKELEEENEKLKQGSRRNPYQVKKTSGTKMRRIVEDK